MKILFVIAFVCLCGPAVFGQWQSQELPRRTCSDCVIVREYDPSTNRTRLWLKMLPIADVTDGKMYLSLSRNVGDPTVAPTKTVYVAIGFIAVKSVEVNETDVVMLADGKPIDLGRAPLGDIITTKSNKKASSYFGVAEWASVLKLGTAEKLELRFGKMEIPFTTEQRAAIRDFLAYAKRDDD